MKNLSLLFPIIIAFVMQLPVKAYEFVDVRPDFEFYNQIKILADKNIIEDASYVTKHPRPVFMPWNTVSRGELASIFVKAMELDNIKINHKLRFSDVPVRNKYYNEIVTATEIGMFDWITSDKFLPDTPATKKDAYHVYAAVIKNIPVSLSLNYQFIDHSSVPDNSVIAVAKCVSLYLNVNATNRNKLDLDSPLYRCELACSLANILANNMFSEKFTGKPEKPVSDVKTQTAPVVKQEPEEIEIQIDDTTKSTVKSTTVIVQPQTKSVTIIEPAGKSVPKQQTDLKPASAVKKPLSVNTTPDKYILNTQDSPEIKKITIPSSETLAPSDIE